MAPEFPEDDGDKAAASESNTGEAIANSAEIICDDNSGAAIVVPSDRSSSSCFGEFSQSVLGFRSSTVHHVIWEEKPSIGSVSAPFPQLSNMAFRFVDPAPFMPVGAH